MISALVGSAPKKSGAGGVGGFVTVYGNGFSDQELSNTAIDGGNVKVYQLAYRFRAPTTANLNKMELFFVGETTSVTTGYSSGTGGIIRVQVCADSGTGLPGAVLSANFDCDKNVMIFNTPRGYTGFCLLPDALSATMSIPMQVGNIYHILFTNIDSSPSVNYMSMDEMGWQPTGQTTLHPGQLNDPSRWSTLHKDKPGSAWYMPTDRWPVLGLRFSNGVNYGHNWMESPDWYGSYSLGGSSINNQLRQNFTPTVNRGPFNTLRFQAQADTSATQPTPLVNIQTTAGVTIPGGSGVMTKDPVYGNAVLGSHAWRYWYKFTFPSFTFQAGTSYRAVFTAPATGSLRSAGARKGSVEIYTGIFTPAANFPDGYGQATTDGWATFDSTLTGGYAQEMDLIFMFSLE